MTMTNWFPRPTKTRSLPNEIRSRRSCGCGRQVPASLERGKAYRRHDGLASITAILLIAACSQIPLHEVHAYSPSTGISRLHHRGKLHGPNQWQSGLLTLRHTPLQKSNWCKTTADARRNTRFFLFAGDVTQHNETMTIIDGESSQGSTNNYRETSPKMDGDAGMVVRGRRATGLSSSVLLPLSESEQNVPLFQTSNQPANPTKETSWKERIMDVSNLASILCVLDCTLLPLVSIAIPALSWGVEFVTGASTAAAGTSSNPIMASLSSLLAYLPALSHGIALYFVIPVGLLTTIVNYLFGHREAKFSLVSFVGVALIYAANSSAGVGVPSVDAWLHSMGIAGGHTHGEHVHNACGAVVGAATGMMAHTCPEGLAHRMTNTLGCAFLLGSNYYSRKYMEDKSQGCAASALAEAWGGDSGGRAVCPPGCNCEAPSYGTSSSSSRLEGETFFQWERTPVSQRKGGRTFTRFRR